MGQKYVSILYNRRKEVERTGVGVVCLSVFGTRECRKIIQVGSTTPDKLDEFVNSPEIQKTIHYYESLANYMVVAGIPITMANLNNLIENGKDVAVKAKSAIKTIDLFEEYLVKESNFKKKTVEKKAHTLELIQEFGKLKTLGDLTPDRLREFDEWLHDGGNRTDVTVYVYHKNLKKWCRMACEDGYLTENPYTKLHITKGRSKERLPLTQEEVDRIMNLELSGNIGNARDMFIFAAFTGLAHCDVLSFDYDTMTEIQHGKVYIVGNRVKSDVEYYTPILEPAMQVLIKHNFHLPRMCDQKVNEYLKIIKEWARIKKPLTFHIARHTFATLAMANGVPVDNVSKMLGHTNLATTQIYAKTLRSTIISNTEKWADNITKTPESTQARVVEQETVQEINPTPRPKRPRIQFEKHHENATYVKSQVPPRKDSRHTILEPHKEHMQAQQINSGRQEFASLYGQYQQPQPISIPSYQPSYPTYPEYSGYSMPSFSYSYV